MNLRFLRRRAVRQGGTSSAPTRYELVVMFGGAELARVDVTYLPVIGDNQRTLASWGAFPTEATISVVPVGGPSYFTNT